MIFISKLWNILEKIIILPTDESEVKVRENLDYGFFSSIVCNCNYMSLLRIFIIKSEHLLRIFS